KGATLSKKTTRFSSRYKSSRTSRRALLPTPSSPMMRVLRLASILEARIFTSASLPTKSSMRMGVDLLSE
ncbi:MAG: hypothetical protein JSV66_03945, partial [Trueperaceae bacterium]